MPYNIISKRPSFVPPQSRLTRLVLVCLLYALLFAVSSFIPALGQQDSGYKLGPEDVIIITVMRHSEFSGEFLVPDDGTINVPRVGQVHVAGKTLDEVATLLTTAFQSTLINPEVSVSLRVQRQQMVYVLGSVRAPGPHQLKPGWRITESISAAGDLSQGIEPADSIVHVLRADTGVRESVTYQQAISGDEAYNKLLHAGDVVTVESPEIISFYVMGKVFRPGAFTLRKDNAGILQAISLAGGTMDDAALSKVTVTHLNGESETISLVSVTLDGKQSEPLKLQSGDLVVVPDYSAKYAVLGWVNSPGIFTMKENQKVSLSDALGMARGIDNRRSGLSRVVVLRSSGDKQERLVFNYTKFAMHGDATQNPEIKPNDIILVSETNKIDWDRILSRISSGLTTIWTLDRFQIN